MRLFSQDAKIEALKQVPIFSQLSKRELARLASRADDLEVEAGKVLCREGTVGREFFAIVEGEVEVTRQGRRIGTEGPGDFIGEIALLCDVPRTATVTATAPLRFFVLTRPAFTGLLDASPGVNEKVLRVLAQRLAAATDDPLL